jgi:hypothetical protein
MNKPITINIEHDGKTAVITLTEQADGGMETNIKFVPAIDKNAPGIIGGVVSRFIKALRN